MTSSTTPTIAPTAVELEESWRLRRKKRLTNAAIDAFLILVSILMLLPLVYGALYLWAFKDPFGNVDKLPVALVNSDRGAQVSGHHINAGDEIVKGMK